MFILIKIIEDMTILKAKVKNLGLDSGRNPIVYLHKNSEIIKAEGFLPLSRLRITTDKNETVVATLHLTDEDTLVGKDEIGFSIKTSKILTVKNGVAVEVKHLEPLHSFNVIKEKLRGKPFTEEGILSVLQDVVQNKYTDLHMSCLCSATEGNQLSEDEIYYMAKAMINTGNRLKWDDEIVVDKHCIGGVPGNRTTMLTIPIVAEFGLTIPKTSSRAITSPSGTADTMEVLTNVDITTDKMKDIVAKAGGCMIWGGGVDLNPSDDIIIKVKKDLDLDSKAQMLASIVSKKVAAGSTHILIDIPYGPSAKCKDKKTANELARDFETLGKKLGVIIKVEATDGTQPIGNGVGPALEAKDVMAVLRNDPKAPQDLVKKTIYLAGKVIEFSPKVKAGEGAKIAEEILKSGRALKRFELICEAQGGMKKIPTAEFTQDILAEKAGTVVEFENKYLSNLAKLAGCPTHKSSGVYLYKHLNDKVQKGEVLYTIHAESKGELELAVKFTKEVEIIKIK